MITLSRIDVLPLLDIKLFLPSLVAFQRTRLDEPVPRTTGCEDGEQNCILAPGILVSNLRVRRSDIDKQWAIGAVW